MAYLHRTLSGPILDAQSYYPVTLVTGARRVGKSTLCRHLFPDYDFVNLEDFNDRMQAATNPVGFLERYPNGVIIDEVQNVPELFSQIQANVDKNKSLRYILTGSSDFRLMKQASQSMAGRVAQFTLPPLTFSELEKEDLNIPTDELLWKGTYPSVWCDNVPVYGFYRRYYSTYIERDIRDYLKIKNLVNFDKFMRLMAGRVGSEFSSSSLSVEVGVSAPTINEWISMLIASYIIFPLQPYYANISKRLTKMQKYYFYDTGLVCFLLGIETPQQLSRDPLRGAIFENAAVAELYRERQNADKENNLYFYREKSGREVDVLQGNLADLHAYEIKSSATLRPEFYRNLNYLKDLLPTVTETTIIFDGPSMAPGVLNLRDI